MRTYYDIDLTGRTITKRELHGEEIVRAGRYLIAKTLLELGAATVDPLSPANPLIFSAGPFAGTSFSNANRTSVGCKSPLTGGIKEANGGGSFSYGLGQLKVAGFTLHGASPEWVVLHFKKDGTIDFDDAAPYLGKGNFEAQQMLHGKYGKKVYVLPKSLDEKVARLHLAKIGVKLTELRKDQADYIGVKQEGPFKSDHYRY